MTLATLSFCIMGAAVKVARTEMAAIEVIAWRCLTSVPLAFAFTASSGFRLRNVRLFFVRAMVGFCAMVCFFTAAKGLALADLSLITRLQPVMVALIAPMALGARERTGPLVWLALAVGLAGCAVLIGPELSLGTQYGVWALTAIGFSAGAHTAVRALGRTDSPRTIVFWLQVTNLVFSLTAYVLYFGTLPGIPSLPMLGAVLICGLAATVGQLLMTKAYQQDRAAIVAAASYSGPLWSVLLDLAVFGLVPGWTVAAGGTLVVAAGYLLYRAENRAPE